MKNSEFKRIAKALISNSSEYSCNNVEYEISSERLTIWSTHSRNLHSLSLVTMFDSSPLFNCYAKWNENEERVELNVFWTALE